MRGWSVFACTLVLSSGCECGTEPGLPDGSLPDGQVPPGSEVHAEIQISPDVIPDGDNFTTSVTLDGTGSTVGPGATIRYAWMIGDGQLAEGTLEDGRIVATFPGDNAVTVALTVTDGAASDTATATIRVDRPPEAILRPASGFAGEAIALDASRSFDREGQPLSFSWSLVEGDPSATITGDAGTASFRSDIPGDYVVRVAVSDGTSTAEADAQVVVIPRPDAQIPWDVQVTATPPRLSPGTPTRLDVTVAGASPSDPLDVEIRVEGAVISMGTARSTMFTPTSAGEHRVVADVTGLGRAGRGRTRVFAASGPDDGAPTVSLSTPGADAVLTTSEIARGTAHDGDLAAYYLEARATDSSGAWIELHRGTSSVNGGDLGPVDVTRMAGFSAFDLRLRAVDAWGNEAMTPPRRIYLSAGETGEVGNLRFGVSDAEIRLSGFPLRLTRTYDSYDAREADFGQNWSMSLDYEEMETHTDGPLGEGWSFDANLCIFGGSGPPDERAHVITVRIGPNLLAYEFTPEFDGCITGLQYFTARFRPIGVSPGTFEVAGDGVRLGLRSGTNQLEYLDSFDVPNGRVFDPTDFALVVDGQRASFEDGRLASVTDRQGNGLTFADDGVTHTSGARLAFVRDAGHRITRVTRPDGRERTYQYNAVGELIAATDWDGRTTRYFYGPDHHLWRILDPRGAVVFDARYDDEGRLEQLYGAGGDGFTQEVDRESGRLVVTHADGSTTVQEFDETGRLTREVGRDGRERTLAYDTDGRTTRRTEDGVTATYRYDPQGNVQFATVGGQPEVELVRTNGRLDALRSGGSSTLELMRTPDGLLTGYRSSAGEVDFGYDARGDLDALSVPGSDALMIARDGYGHPDSMRFGDLDVDIDASEVGDVEAIRFMHDGRMHEIHAEYDGEGRPVAITAMVDGAMVRDERIVTDADGERMRRGDLDTVRDAQGRVTHRLTPDGSGYSIAYDVGGRPARMTSPSGRVTQLDYRPADGVVRRISPTGLIEITTLDAEGRVSAVETGGVTRRYGYDAAGRLHTVTGPDGQDTVLDYDDSGRPVRMELPDGTVLEDIYTNGVLTERRRDGTTMTTLSYAPTGEVSGIASAMGVAIDVEYDPLGEVSAVSAPGLGTTSYEHDAGGLTAIVDGEGRRTEIARAALGTETTTTLPSGRTYRAFHDPMSGESVSVLPDGASVRTLLDGRSRPTAITADDGTTATFTYDRDGEIASLAVAGREVNLTYDAEGRFVQILESDGRVVRYAYERTFGHLDTLTTPGGADTFLYDADGALDGVVTAAGPTVMVSHRAPGGAPTAWTVGPITITADAPHGGDATVRVESGGAVRFEERYGYDTDQRVSAITRPGGVSSTFHYDGLNRLVQEERASGAITFGYDRASNLVSREVDGASASFSVDVDDRLTQGDGERFDYDERGRLVAIHGGRDITLGYDGLDRLVHVETSG
ncbi:MAG: PKD domain-containing protein, partial [Sandaracinaceae bacterium]